METHVQKPVFKSVQRLEWDTEGSTRKLRHMTRGRVLWVDAVTHGDKKLRTFNVEVGRVETNNT